MAFAFAWLSGLGFRVACKTSAVIGTLTPCRVLGVAGCKGLRGKGSNPEPQAPEFSGIWFRSLTQVTNL